MGVMEQGRVWGGDGAGTGDNDDPDNSGSRLVVTALAADVVRGRSANLQHPSRNAAIGVTTVSSSVSWTPSASLLLLGSFGLCVGSAFSLMPKVESGFLSTTMIRCNETFSHGSPCKVWDRRTYSLQ